MSAPISSLSLSPSPSLAGASSIFTSKFRISQKTQQLSLQSEPPICRSVSTRGILDFQKQKTRVHTQSTQIWRISASSKEVSTTVDAAQEVVASGSGDGVTVIIQVLLFVAFAALSVLTIGVIYIGVTDFLQKREKDKFEKDEASKKSKKGGKKKAVRSRAGPRGFGQKIEVDDDDF